MEEESRQLDPDNQMSLKGLLISSQNQEGTQSHNEDSKPLSGKSKECANALSPNSCEQMKGHGNSPSRGSPDPSCAICLGQLENKSFTDSCFHTFCFTCLLEWSKVKAECPLCKQPFKSIVHNVRSIEDYDQYYINSRGSENSWQSPDGRRFRYPSTMTAERRRHMAFEDSIEYRTHRLMYAPHSVSSSSVRGLIAEFPSTSSFRRRIYETGLWVKPFGDGNTQRYRSTSPDFYRQNPACTHRLIPWLNRELLALLYDSENQVTFVLELILALIMRYDIRSQEFYVHIQPYLQDRTSHFIHEFFNYARSPYEMSSYDNRAIYERLESFAGNVSSVISTPGSDVIALPSIESPLPEVSSSTNIPQISENSTRQKKIKNKQTSKSLTKLFLRRNQESDIWQSVWATTPQQINSHSSSSSLDSPDFSVSAHLQEFLDTGVMPGPSTSGFGRSTTSGSAKTYSIIGSSANRANSDNEDCMIVGVVKPKSLRTPEFVDLVSSSDDETIATIIASQNENTVSQVKESEPTEKPYIRKVSDQKPSLARECKRKQCKPSEENKHSGQQSSVSDKYKSKKSTLSKKHIPKRYAESINEHSENAVVSKRESFSQKSSSQSGISVLPSVQKYDRWSRSRSRSESRSRSREHKSSSWSPPRDAKKKEKSNKSKHQDYNNATDSSIGSSLSEDEGFQSTGTFGSETKVKLRSVVWHFSSEHQYSRSDSSHHSSHSKKHKDKRKKKKKHGKHKHHHHHKHHSHSVDSE